jgi:hypothetical protein
MVGVASNPISRGIRAPPTCAGAAAQRHPDDALRHDQLDARVWVSAETRAPGREGRGLGTPDDDLDPAT